MIYGGLKIAKPGIYAGIKIEDYHEQCTDGPSVSSSGLRKIVNQSLAHFWCENSLNPEREPEDDTAAFILGRAAHHLLLGEDEFSTLFVARPETIQGEAWQGNRKACKAWLQDQASAGRTVLLPAQIKAIRGMAKSLAAHPLIKSGILNGDIERSMFSLDKETGIWKKARPDAIPTDSGDFADLKHTTSVRYEDLQRTIADYGYHQQGAMVGEVYKEITGKPMTSFSLVFVESKPPHCVRVVTLKDDDLERGRQQNRMALKMLRRALDTNAWPGPGDYEDATFIELPQWKQTRIDSDLAYLKTLFDEKKDAA